MAKKAKKKAKNKGGRPTKYKPEFVKIAGELCQEKGYTNKNLAQHFGVSESVIKVWKNRYSAFLATIKKGKDSFDSQVVEQVLLKRAKGYSYDETTKEPVIVDKGKVDGEVIEEGETVEEAVEQSLVITKVVTKEVAPSEVAIIFWLKNREPQRWSDKKEIDHRIKEIAEPLTAEQMRQRLEEVAKAGTGIDEKSIEGNGNNGSSNGATTP